MLISICKQLDATTRRKEMNRKGGRNMKRFLSMLLVSSMVVSMVPATAFAKGDVTATAKVLGMLEVTKNAVEENNKIINQVLGGVPELQIKITDADYRHTADGLASEDMEVTVSLDNAKFMADQDFTKLVYVRDDDRGLIIDKGAAAEGSRLTVSVDADDIEEDEVTFTFSGNFEEDDVIAIPLYSVMDKTSEGRTATVSVESDMLDVDALTYVEILSEGFKASVKELESIGLEEFAEINSRGLKIEAAVGYLPKELTLKLNKGFEFAKSCDGLNGDGYSIERESDTELTVTVDGNREDITIKGTNGGKGIVIEAATAKAGDIASIKISAKNVDSTSVEVLKVVDADVELRVDKDEDLPIIYSGVGVDNYGLTDDSDHMSLEVTLEESFPGAWDMKKAFKLELPEGVYVAQQNADGKNGVEVTEVEGLYQNGKEVSASELEAEFLEAYQNGDYLEFEFKKRTFDNTDASDKDKCAKMSFTLALVADPTFAGDVTLKLTGDAVEEQEADIATFVKAYDVKAEQNDLKIDYRYTEVPSDIVVTEAEAGLWAEKEAVFQFAIDRGDVMQFEKDATFTVDDASDMEINDSTSKNTGKLAFQVKEESDDEAAVVTISDMELYMSRDIPAGFYDLELTTSMEEGSDIDASFSGKGSSEGYLGTVLLGGEEGKDYIVDDVADYENVVKEGFINVITPGKDVEGFTTKVVVPVGENYIKSGDKEIALDVPAYINADGYTMLPVRAVAKALGISDNAVLWDQPTRTVTIMHGQRIISMTLGQKYVTVNGSALPASSAVEIKDGRTFLPMRDLATALGVTDITWDSATRTATLNGNK